MAAVSAIAIAPQKVTRSVPFRTFERPTRAATAPSSARKASDSAATISPTCAAGRDDRGCERKGGPHGERCGGCERRLDRAREQDLGDSELVARMCAERVLGHQLFRDFGGKLRVEAALDVDRRELPVLGVDVGLELLALARKIRMLGVRLRADRDVFAGRHRHRAGHEAGEPGHHHGAAVRAGGGDADHEACGRDDAVVRAEDRRPEPADAARAMSFAVAHVTSG